MLDDIISLEMSGPLAGVLHQQVKMEILVNRFQSSSQDEVVSQYKL